MDSSFLKQSSNHEVINVKDCMNRLRQIYKKLTEELDQEIDQETLSNLKEEAITLLSEVYESALNTDYNVEIQKYYEYFTK